MWDTLPWCRGQTGSSRDVSVGNKVGSLQVVQTELPPPPHLSDAHAGGPTQGPRTSESRGSIVGGAPSSFTGSWRSWCEEKPVRPFCPQTSRPGGSLTVGSLLQPSGWDPEIRFPRSDSWDRQMLNSPFDLLIPLSSLQTCLTLLCVGRLCLGNRAGPWALHKCP